MDCLLGSNSIHSSHGRERGALWESFLWEFGTNNTGPKTGLGGEKGRGRTVWATGDVVLESLGDIHWETKEYILEENGSFLPEINRAHRRIAIVDSEQLAATGIVLSWSNSATLLLLGTDDRNVSARTRKGCAKKGSGLIMNKETSMWIANRGAQVEGVYVRSGRNLIPDWVTRASYDQIEKRAGRPGFTRVRAKPLWGEMMQDYRSLRLSEVMMPECRAERTDNKHLVCVERHGGGSWFAEEAQCFGLTVQLIQARHGRAINQFCRRYDFGPYIAGGISLSGGSARVEDEVVMPRQSYRMYPPKYDALITPLGVDMADCNWDCMQMVESTVFGDVLGSIWQIGVCGMTTLNMCDGPVSTTVATTIGDRYMECGFLAQCDERGIINRHGIQFRRGLEVAITDENGTIG